MLKVIQPASMLEKFRNSKEEYWHRRNTFLMIYSAIESGLPIANALGSHIPLYEPLSTELETVHNGILAGRTLSEIAEIDFKKSSLPKWLKYLIKYEKKGQLSNGFLRLSRLQDDSFHKKIFWNLVFSRSDPPSIFAWIVNIFLVCMVVPILPWEIKGDKIYVLDIYKGSTTNIYSVGERTLFSNSELIDNDSSSNQGTDSVDSGEHMRKGDYLYDLMKYVGGEEFEFNFPEKKEFIKDGEILGYKKGELECIWGKELHRTLLSDNYKFDKLIKESAPSPVPIIWMVRGIIGSVLEEIAKPEIDEKAIIEKSCKDSKLTNIFNRLSSSDIQR